tara:strand:- start:800 stop:1345 length:546 start_codon:yes stop_codon:yes gene_type:complete
MNQQTGQKIAYFGGGCFWCIEAAFEGLCGVTNVVSGYSGGDTETANYLDVSTGKTQHAEVCKITYQPKKISLNTLLEVFFLAHDPTTINRQGNDIGTQYRSIIFYNNNIEKNIINNHIKKLEQQNVYHEIQTEIKPFTQFHEAEQYHQNYFYLNPNKPYCSLIINPKIQSLRKKLKTYYVK